MRVVLDTPHILQNQMLPVLFKGLLDAVDVLSLHSLSLSLYSSHLTFFLLSP